MVRAGQSFAFASSEPNQALLKPHLSLPQLSFTPALPKLRPIITKASHEPHQERHTLPQSLTLTQDHQARAAMTQW